MFISKKSLLLFFAVPLLLQFISSTESCTFFCGDYFIPTENDQLEYTTSNKFPKQIAVINSSSEIGVIVDSEKQRVAILNGATGTGLILDKSVGVGYQIKIGGWSMYKESLKDYIKDCDLDALIEDNNANVFELEGQDQLSTAVVILKEMLMLLSPEFLKEIIADTVDLFSGVLEVFGFIMYPLKEVFKSIISLKCSLWVVFKGGFSALITIFKMLGKLVSTIAGGLVLLAQSAVVISLTSIITALDGAQAFCVILRAIAEKLDLMKVLYAVLTSPIKIAKFIVGLGGKVLKGVTGIFTLILRLFTFSIFKIASVIKDFTEIILNLLRGDRPSIDNVITNVKPLIEIGDEQGAKYNTGEDFKEYRRFLVSTTGDSSFEVQGIKIGPLVKVLTKTGASAKVILVESLKIISPLVPFDTALPQLLVNMVKSLNTTSGPSYVQQILPNLRMPKDGIYEAGQVFRSSMEDESFEEMRNLPATGLLRALPIVKDIYNELDEVAQRYHNASLDSMLQRHHVGELVEFTTKAFGLV